MATIAIKLATVFIGICTDADSEIFNAINYLLNVDTILSDTHFQPALILSQTLQQMFLHLFIMFFLLNLVKEVISI